VNVLEMMPAAFVAMDHGFRIIFVNEMAEVLMRRPRAEVLGRVLWDEYPELIGTPFHTAGTRAMAERVPVDVEEYYEPSDSWFEVHAYPVDQGLSVYFQDISQRKRAEEALRQGEARTAAVVRSALDCVLVMDEEGLIREFNPAAEQVFGYSREEAVGRPLAEVIIPERLRSRHREGLERYLATGEEHVLGRRLELTALRKDGSEFPAEVAISRGDAPGPPLFTGFIRDITRRVQREAAAKRLVSIVESSQDAIIGKTLEGIVTSWNKGAERMYGYTAEEMVGRPIGLLAPQDQPSEIEDILRKLARGERTVDFETVRVGKDGSLIDVSLTVSPIRANDGTVIGASTVARDITHRKREEAQRDALLDAERDARAQAEAARADAEEAKERLTFLTEASAVLAGSLDYAATLDRLASLAVSWLADWCLIETLQPDGLLAPAAVAHRDPDRLDWLRRLLVEVPSIPTRPMGPASVIRTGRPELYAEITDELLATAALDQRTLDALREMNLASVMVIPLLSRAQVVGAVTLVSSDRARTFRPEDMALAEELALHATLAIDKAKLYMEAETLATELEHRVAERTAELEASNRELEAFSYSVSHDLRAPLRAIDGFSRILLKDFGSEVPGQAREYLEIVREGAQQMGRLIDDLLAFARLGRQSLSKQRVDPTQIVHRVLEQLRTDMEGLDVEVRIGDLPPCHADPSLLQQVFVNLLANALKFTRTRSPAMIEIGSSVDHGHTAYFVKDNGVGFDMRFADKLFGVFQRMHRAEDYEGTGVGLAIVQRVVHRHGGRVWAEAESDAGATFSFTLDGALADD